MTESDREDAHWSIDVPGLTRSQAEALLAQAELLFGLNGSAVDPDRWLTRHLDLETVQGIVRGLSTTVLDDRDRVAVDGVLDDFRDWAQRSAGR